MRSLLGSSGYGSGFVSGVFHLFSDFVDFSGLGKQLIDDSIDTRREGFESGNGFSIRFRKVHLVSVDCFVSGQSSSLKNADTSRTQIEFFNALGKRIGFVLVNVLDQTFCCSPKHCTGCARGFRVYRLGFFVNLSHIVRHQFMSRCSFLFRPNLLFINPKSKTSAPGASSNAGFFIWICRDEFFCGNGCIVIKSAYAQGSN